ncbi:molybdenum cofactor guanylyltransferase [Enterococcus sp. RIT-PI-f]|uniref:molybdenum cofactor guanylyltransferase n=1 Tax=Enterococcus sp. RIT-PI-f TaxID=1690244 RepID=UPI0006B90EF3|nr:NTP transferase domain-containing protein [Enterococcus sp. RIT-PI-f]KPG74247.1 hypothetical protein AEQ18_00355 [Enterococcus sp. RIT-PI-f]
MIGVLLAGGYSRRFKQDKALYYDPRLQATWLESALQRLMEITESCCIIANSKNYNQIVEEAQPFPTTTLMDLPEFAGLGPLSGIYTAAKRYPGERLLVTAIDYPFLTSQSLNKLTFHRNAYAVSENQPHFAITHLTIDDQLLEILEIDLANKTLRLGDFLKKISAEPVELPTNELFTTNNPITVLYKNDPF